MMIAIDRQTVYAARQPIVIHVEIASIGGSRDATFGVYVASREANPLLLRNTTV